MHLTDEERAIMQERLKIGCRTCTDCVGYSHHWIEDYSHESHTCFTCKHCDALGDYCPDCGGDGCESCDSEGVILFVAEVN